MMVARADEGRADAFLAWLQQNEVTMTDAEINTLRAYFLRLVSDHRRGDAARPWFRHCAPREMMDDHLLIAGLSELSFKENVVAIGCNSAMQFRGQMYGRGGGEKVQLLTGRVEEAVLRGWTNRSFGITLIVPVNIDRSHWGAIFAVADGPGTGMGGKVFWGDSMGISSPSKYREAVRDFLQAIPGPDMTWIVSDENYMTDVLRLAVQEDCYSCGFYVVSTAMIFADDRGGMPAGNYARYSAQRTEKIRVCCAQSYVAAVLSVASGMTESDGVVHDLDVYDYLSDLLLGEMDPLKEDRGTNAIITLSSNSEDVGDSSEEVDELCVDGEAGALTAGNVRFAGVRDVFGSPGNACNVSQSPTAGAQEAGEIGGHKSAGQKRSSRVTFFPTTVVVTLDDEDCGSSTGKGLQGGGPSPRGGTADVVSQVEDDILDLTDGRDDGVLDLTGEVIGTVRNRVHTGGPPVPNDGLRGREREREDQQGGRPHGMGRRALRRRRRAPGASSRRARRVLGPFQPRSLKGSVHLTGREGGVRYSFMSRNDAIVGAVERGRNAPSEMRSGRPLFASQRAVGSGVEDADGPVTLRDVGGRVEVAQPLPLSSAEVFDFGGNLKRTSREVTIGAGVASGDQSALEDVTAGSDVMLRRDGDVVIPLDNLGASSPRWFLGDDLPGDGEPAEQLGVPDGRHGDVGVGEVGRGESHTAGVDRKSGRPTPGWSGNICEQPPSSGAGGGGRMQLRTS